MSWKLLDNLKGGFKAKPGGTFAGNLLRGLVHNQTDGEFGNGAMMLQEGENNKQWSSRIFKGLSTAFGAGAAAGQADMQGGFKWGVIQEKIKRFLPYVIGGVALIIGLPIVIRLVKKATKKVKKY